MPKLPVVHVPYPEKLSGGVGMGRKEGAEMGEGKKLTTHRAMPKLPVVHVPYPEKLSGGHTFEAPQKSSPVSRFLSVKDFRDGFKDLLKAKSKLKKMKELDRQGSILHSIRTKAVEFQTKNDSVKEKSAAAVAKIHLENQKRLQAEFIASKELEVEEIQAAVGTHVATLATKMEEYIKGLSSNPDLVVSDAAKERYRRLKGRCIEKAQSDIAAAKDEMTIREIDRQHKLAAEDLKKAAAAEEVPEMEMEPAIEEILAKHAKKIEDKLRREITQKLEASLSKKLQKNLHIGEQNSSQAASADKKQMAQPGRQDGAPGKPKPKKKRGGKTPNKQNSSADKEQQAKGPTTSKAKGPKNGGGGPEKGPHKK
ncbi:unnamed protein product [Closterium sp. NIES-64]|nr:unnamed protein product [Closterium sp. NIES-64]